MLLSSVWCLAVKAGSDKTERKEKKRKEKMRDVPRTNDQDTLSEHKCILPI